MSTRPSPFWSSQSRSVVTTLWRVTSPCSKSPQLSPLISRYGPTPLVTLKSAPIGAREENVHWEPPSASCPSSPTKNPMLSRSLAVDITENCRVAVKVSPRSQASGPEINTGDEVISLALQTLPLLLNEGRQLVPLIGKPWARTGGAVTKAMARTKARAAQTFVNFQIKAHRPQAVAGQRGGQGCTFGQRRS